MGGYSWHGMHASHEPSVTSRSSSLHLDLDLGLCFKDYHYTSIEIKLSSSIHGVIDVVVQFACTLTAS